MYICSDLSPHNNFSFKILYQKNVTVVSVGTTQFASVSETTSEELLLEKKEVL